MNIPGYDPTLPNVGQNVGQAIPAIAANEAAIAAELFAHEQNNSNAHGIDALLAAVADYLLHKANTTNAHGIDAISAQANATSAEVTAARGSQASLAARLATALGLDGSIRLSNLNNKWITNGDIPTFVDTTHFTVPGDKTQMYIAGAQLRLTISANYAFAPVASRSFGSGVTTVVLDPAYPILTSGLSAVDMGLIAWDNTVAASCTTNATNITALQGQVTSLKIEEVENFLNGKPGASAVIDRYIATRAFSIPSGATGSQFKGGTAATASTVFTLAKNGAAFGTATFAAAGTSATFAVAVAVAVAAGDVLTITAPGSQDATLADLVWNIQGVLP